MFAVRDRNNHDDDVWRLVRLQFLADEPLEKQWRLLSEDGTLLDEGDDGCPARRERVLHREPPR